MDPVKAVSPVRYRTDIQLVPVPGGLGRLLPVRSVETLPDRPVLRADKEDRRPAFIRIFDDRKEASVRGRFGIVEPSVPGQVMLFEIRERHVADPRGMGEGPPGIPYGLGPVDAPFHRVPEKGTGFFGERADPGLPAVPDEEEFRFIDLTLATDDQAVPGGEAVDIVGMEGTRLRNRFHGHEGGPSGGLLLPEGVEMFGNVPEGIPERTPRHRPDAFLHRSDGPGTGGRAVVIVLHEQRIPVEIAHPGDGHVPDFIIVRGEIPVGAIAPAVPVAPAPFVEGDTEVIEELCRTGAGTADNSRLESDRVPLGKRLSGIECPDGGGNQLPEGVIQRFPDSAVSGLELGQMAGFMGRKREFPRGRIPAVWFGTGENVHPVGSAEHRCVRIAVMGMQDDRRAGDPSGFPGGHADAPPCGFPEALQVHRVDPREGVGPFGIDDPVVRRIDPPPAEPPGVGTLGEELGRCGERKGEKDRQRQNHSFHRG